MVNLVTRAVACVLVCYEATPPNAAAGFSPRRRRFWYKTAACITNSYQYHRPGGRSGFIGRRS